MTFRRIANSIATRIILIGVLLLVTGNVARYVTLSKYLRDGITEVVAAQQLTLASYVARKVDHEIVDRQESLVRLAGALPLDLLHKPQVLQNWLAKKHLSQPLFSQGLLVCTADGNTVAASALSVDLALSPCSDPHVQQVARDGKFVVGRALRDSAATTVVLPMATAIKDAAGNARAALVGTSVLGVSGFVAFTPQDKIGKTGSFLMVSPRDKVFIAATDPGMVLKATPPPGANPFHDRAMQGNYGTDITVNAVGTEEISSVVPVPSTGWFVVVRLPTEEAFAAVGRTQSFVAGISTLTLVGFLIVSSVLLYFVFRPLLQAAGQADRMTRGEAPLEPLKVVRQDEVGHLTDAFNRLLEKLRASQSEMAHMAHHDVLTGLPNRALLADRLTQALARVSRHGGRIAFLCLDLDKFKPINDELGHAAGDLALKEVARRLGAVVRESDTLARIGGDEFALLLADLDADPAVAEQVATAVAAKCLAAFAPPFVLQSHTRSLGASIGIAMGNGLMSPHALQLAADSAMYQAKNDGGQRYRVAAG